MEKEEEQHIIEETPGRKEKSFYFCFIEILLSFAKGSKNKYTEHASKNSSFSILRHFQHHTKAVEVDIVNVV